MAATEMRTRSSFRRGQILAALAFALVTGGVLARDVFFSPASAFLVGGDAPWIVARTPLQTHGMVIELAHPPTALFARTFAAEPGTQPVLLHVRGLREVELFLNDRPLPLASADATRWRAVRTLDLRPHLEDGRNVLAARVRNPGGNPALQIWIDGLGPRIETDARWLAAWEGDPVSYAVLAEDSVRHPEASELPAPPAALARHALALVVLAAGGAALFLALRRLPPRAARFAPRAAFALLAGVWLLLLRKVLALPPEVGFDAAVHLQYIDWIALHHALPDPAAGSAMYHPPLYHALSALLLALLQPTGVARHAVVSLLPMASGLGMAWVAGAMARAVLPGAPWLEAATIVAAGLLPMNLTIASCVSNEGPHGFLASLALLFAVRALLRPRATACDDALLGAALGAAALTKYSILLWIPLLVGMLAAKRLAVERAGLARAAAGAALASAVVLALAGWVYVRNVVIAGDPLIWNLNATPGESWWQLPGFHTAAYFLRFGDALVLPWFASFHSFWDSLYSTLWGDGLLSGAVDPHTAVRRWRYDAMAAGFLLALPATGLIALGWLRALRDALRGGELGRRLVLSLLVLLPPLLVAPLASACMRYPFWSGPKAFYVLGLTPTLALLGVIGFAAFDALLAARLPFALRALPSGWAAALALRALPYGWAAAFLATIAWSYAG